MKEGLKGKWMMCFPLKVVFSLFSSGVFCCLTQQLCRSKCVFTWPSCFLLSHPKFKFHKEFTHMPRWVKRRVLGIEGRVVLNPEAEADSQVKRTNETIFTKLRRQHVQQIKTTCPSTFCVCLRRLCMWNPWFWAVSLTDIYIPSGSFM